MHLRFNPQQWRIQDFPEEGAPTPWGRRQHKILPNFPKKLHEIERIWAPGGSVRPSLPPLRSATAQFKSKT